jgi:hypothetical protein
MSALRQHGAWMKRHSHHVRTARPAPLQVVERVPDPLEIGLPQLGTTFIVVDLLLLE